MEKEKKQKGKQRERQFEENCRRLEKEGYQGKEVISKGGVLYGLGMAIAICAGMIGIAQIVKGGPAGVLQGGSSVGEEEIIVALVCLLASVPIHELLHGLGWRLSKGVKWENIHITAQEGMPLCHCDKEMLGKEYFLGVMLPVLLLGLLPAIGSFFIPVPWLVFFSLFNIAIAGGDLWIGVTSSRHWNDLLLDHPVQPGFMVFQQKKKEE